MGFNTFSCSDFVTHSASINKSSAVVPDIDSRVQSVLNDLTIRLSIVASPIIDYYVGFTYCMPLCSLS